MAVATSKPTLTTTWQAVSAKSCDVEIHTSGVGQIMYSNEPLEEDRDAKCHYHNQIIGDMIKHGYASPAYLRVTEGTAKVLVEEAV